MLNYLAGFLPNIFTVRLSWYAGSRNGKNMPVAYFHRSIAKPGTVLVPGCKNTMGFVYKKDISVWAPRPARRRYPIASPTQWVAIGSEDKPVRRMEKALRPFPSP